MKKIALEITVEQYDEIMMVLAMASKEYSTLLAQGGIEEGEAREQLTIWKSLRRELNRQRVELIMG